MQSKTPLQDRHLRMASVRYAVKIPAPLLTIKALRPHTVFDNLHQVVQPKAIGEGARRLPPRPSP